VKNGAAWSRVAVICLTLVSSACTQSSPDSFARLVEQAASWAATARYAGELHAAGEVPDAYLQNVIETGTQELQALRAEEAKATHIPDDERERALTLTGDLQSLFSGSPSGHADSTKLAEVEARLHELAGKVRGS
jgi:hypothetical protein